MQNKGRLNANTSVFPLISIITVRCAENLVKVTTSASQTKPLAIFVKISLLNSMQKSRTDVGTLRNRSLMEIPVKTTLTFWGMMSNLLLALKQSWKVLLKTYFHLLLTPNPSALKHCQLKRQSHQPQVLHYKIRLKIGWKSPWAIYLTSN